MGLTKVLLAVRDQGLRSNWSSVLRSKGFAVLEAATFLEARKKCSERPDLAVVDLELSRGEENQLVFGRAINHTVPTIVVTECPNMEIMRECFRRKPGYLPPVVDFIGIEEGVEKLIKAILRVIKPRVFVSHGHDLGAKEEVVRFLKELELRPEVLSEGAEIGRTIIEKIEDYSDVTFAVILLTPDDKGGEVAGELKPRARQNVIFELGYFFAKLGRKKVVALCKKEDGELEMPSNYSGILYLPMDPTGGWKMRLAQEMREADFEIDLNLVLRS